jgi:osmotically-inducible protein OsmY
VASRGPRGWVRSDERILDDLCERIVRGGVDASRLEVQVEDGHVWLEGDLGSREERRFVLEVAERSLGVRGVYAEIHVPEAAGASAEGEADDGPTWH